MIIGGVLLAGAGVAVAAGAGGGSSSSSSNTPVDNRTSQVFTYNVSANNIRGFTVTASKAGALEATLTWTTRTISLTIDCQEHNPPYTQCGHSNRTTDRSASLTASVTQKEDDIIVNNFTDVGPEGACSTSPCRARAEPRLRRVGGPHRRAPWPDREADRRPHAAQTVAAISDQPARCPFRRTM